MTVPSLSDAAIKEGTQLVRDFAGNFSELTSTMIGILTANTQAFAASNLYRLKDKLDAKNAERASRGLTLIPPRLAIPMLSRIALEDDEDMLELWANLISSFQSGDAKIKPNKVFIHILSEMEPLDTRVLQHAISCNSKLASAPSHEMQMDDFAKTVSASKEDTLLSFYNLARLGCFHFYFKGVPIQEFFASGAIKVGGMKIDIEQDPNEKPERMVFVGKDVDFVVAYLGEELLKACSAAASNQRL